MKSLVYALAAIVLLVVALLLVILVKLEAADFMYAVLGACVAGLTVTALALRAGHTPHRAMLLLVAAPVGATAAWLVANLCLRVTTISLYSSTALAFDLVVGAIGGAATSLALLERQRKAGQS
jgi:hypothetical protein